MEESIGDLRGAQQRADELLRMGEPLLAYEAIEVALPSWPRDLRLRQLRGLALARSGAAERANQAMRELRGEGHVDGETLGILARTHKDLRRMGTMLPFPFLVTAPANPPEKRKRQHRPPRRQLHITRAQEKD